MTPTERRHVAEFLDGAFDDVEKDLYYAIKTRRDDRPVLLTQLDVITKAKERIHARIDRTDPATQ